MAQYTYSERNNFLERLDYGNGDGVQYEYDKQGRVTSQTYENGDTVTYRYDNNGALASVTDSATGRTTTYYYDFTNRLMKYMETGDINHSVQYTYDEQNKLTKLVEVINGATHTTYYTYDDDQRLASILNRSGVISYTYDDYGRVSQKTDGIFTYVYTYKDTDAGAPTGQVATISVMLNGSACTTFQYTYDDNGNILSVNDAGMFNTYVYDSAGQLIRENNLRASRTWVWTYDDAGNILSKSEYAYSPNTLRTPIDTIVYTYGDDAWGDLLTAYDGVAITYDEMGNPLTDGTWTYTWEHGRQLASMTNGDTTWAYTYDANGMRTSRSDGTDTYTYIYNGSKLMQMTVGTNTLTFTYDGSGNPYTVTLNGTTYYYITNLQGDVIQIRTASGAPVCNYSYDAWGNVVSASNYANAVLYSLNPLLYRGYVYDHDTGLYYLQSRYYNPTIGRFINADVYTSTGQGVLGNNMFAYCGNNPINRVDASGCAWYEDVWEWMNDTAEDIAEYAEEVVDYISDSAYQLYYDATEWHFENRAKKNGAHPTYSDVSSKNSGWTLLPENQSIYHDNGVGNAELKYITSDGREAVFDGDTFEPVTDPRYIATYNYCPLYQMPSTTAGALDYVKLVCSGIGHFFADMVPYYLAGNSNTREQFESKCFFFD